MAFGATTTMVVRRKCYLQRDERMEVLKEGGVPFRYALYIYHISVSYEDMLYRIISCPIILCYAVLYHVILSYAIPYYIMPLYEVE